jgi:2'-hydroxyisoflavone reductase
MSLRRRDFLALAAAAAGCATRAVTAAPTSATAPAATTRPKRILVLGGTGFLGPCIVRAARARGHMLTLFNRGKTNPGLFPEVETILGDRRTDIDRLRGREWDAVVDTWVLLPRSVRAMTELLRDHVGQYLFVSTISVYKLGRAAAPIDEQSPTLPEPSETPKQIGPEAYGGLKAAAERAVEAGMPGRATNIRAGVLVGPGDPSDRFLYWPLRLARGGEALVPGAPDDRMTFVDVRDLGDWIVACIEARVVGTFNAVGPSDPRLGAVLDEVRAGVASDARLTFVDGEWLAARNAGGWGDFPLAVLKGDEQASFGQVSAARAIARGLRFRPPSVTAHDVLAWYQAEPEARRAQPRPGIDAAREAELLGAWHARS